MSPEIQVRPDNYCYKLLGQSFLLSSEKVVFWEDQRLLIVSDVHLGKAGHFRKHGIPIPRQVHVSDIQRINALIEAYNPSTILFLGDLFHSVINEEWDDFAYWSHFHREINQILVLGNHDKHTHEYYQTTSVDVKEVLELGPFLFSHEPVSASCYNLAGHIHPSVKIHGLARQGMTLPCFYFGRNNGILPAFGNFTGSHPVKPVKGDVVFAIADQILVELLC